VAGGIARGSRMLAYLLNTPTTPQEWSVWSYAHRDQHKQILQAIQTQYNINLAEYPLDPIALDDFADFLNWNQRAHNDFNGVLNAQGSDLQQADLTDPNQREAWIYLHRREHETAANILHLG
jgi:hypothetical protein